MNSDTHPYAEALVAWYLENARDLPWRGTSDPYRIWVSEVMLQQTRVATVIPFYHRFLARFPSLRALADADLDDVLAAWAGLGYYRRARALHAGARSLAPGFEMPDTVAGLLGVPGIGPYTAGAIASMAYGLDAPIVDGNVIRVLCRQFGLHGDPYAAPLKAELWALSEQLLPAGQASDFNQGLMELGALLCTPRGPRCHVCPVADTCVARAEGLEEELPQRRVRGPRKVLRLAVAIVRSPSGGVLVRRRPADGLFGGMWEFPSAPMTSEEWASGGLGEQLGLEGRKWASGPVVVRQLTHRELVLVPGICQVRDLAVASSRKFVDATTLGSMGMPAAFRALAVELGLR